ARRKPRICEIDSPPRPQVNDACCPRASMDPVESRPVRSQRVHRGATRRYDRARAHGPKRRRSMQFAVTFRHMEPTDALKAYAKERMERVRKYLPDPIACHVVLSTERHNHRIDVSFQLHNGLAIAGHETTENMYSSIDLCIAKIERQVRKYKGKLEGMRARPHHVQPLSWSHSIIDEAFSHLGDEGTNGHANG